MSNTSDSTRVTSGCAAEHVGHWPAEVAGVGRDVENTVGLVVDERQPAVSGDGQHSVADARHNVPEERVSFVGTWHGAASGGRATPGRARGGR